MESKPRQAPPTPVDELASLRQRVVALEARLAQVQESEAFYHGLVDSAGEAVLVVDARTGLVQECNRRAESLFGQPRAQIIGRPHTQLHPPAAAAQYVDLFRRVAAGEVVGAAPTTIQRTDGGAVCVEVSASLHELGDQRLILGLFRDVTERTRSEEALRASEQRHRALFEHFGDAVLLLSDQGILDCNETALRLFGGTSRADLIGRQPWTLAPPTQPDGRSSSDGARTFARAAGAAGLARFEWMHQRLTGEPFPAEVLVAVFPTGDRRLLYAVVRDITAQKQAAAALESTRLLLEAVIEQSPVPMAVASAPDHVIRFANQAALIQLGIAGDAPRLGQTLADVQRAQTWRDLYPDGTPVSLNEMPLARALRGETTWNEEYRVIRKDGTERWQLVSGTPVYNRAGELIAGLIVFPDITERKRAEEERARLIAILEQTIDLVATTTLDGRFTYMNAAGRRLLGWSPTEDVSLRQIADSHPAWAHARIIATGIPTALANGVWQGETALLGPDGREVPVSQVIVAHCTETGEPIYLSTIMRDIREQRRAEEQLRLAEFSIERSGLPTTWFDRRGRVVRVNEAACQSLGYSRDELLQLAVRDFDPDFQDPEKWDGIWHEMRAHGRCLAFETRHRRKDGTCFPVEIVSSYFAYGQQEYIFSFARDITARRRSEAELRESERKYRGLSQEFRTILEAIPGSLVLISPDMKIVWANEYTKNTSMGLESGEMLGQHCYRCRHGLATPCEACPVQRCFVSGKPESGERDTPDGHIWELHAAPVWGDQGEIKGVIEVAHDVTDYRRADRELKASESRLRGLFRAAPIGILFTQHRTTVSVNDALCELLGHSQAELIGQTSRLSYFTEEEFQEVGRKLYGAVPAGGCASVETRLRRKDGTAIDVLLTSAPLHAEEPGAGFVVTMQDITERKRAERALQSRIVAMTRPLDDASNITFSDLFDLEEIQNLQDAFAESSGVAALITAPDGTPLTRPSGFCRLCAEFVRQSAKGQQRCVLSDAALGRDCRDGPTVRPCLSAGLWGAGASITVGGKHIANWLIGQVRDESLDLEQISRYAREIDADPEEFRRALLEVPAMSEAQFRKIARTLFVLSQELSSKAYQNVQQARFIMDLKRAEDERDRLFNASLDLLSIGNLTGDFKQVNPAWTSSLGWSAEELTRTHPSEFVHPDDAAATVAAAERLRQGRALRSFENRFRCKNGSYRWLSWNAYAILEQGLVFAVGRDVTELKAAETERTRLEAQLRQSQKMEAVGQLAGGVAHDFNNILTAIFGNVDIVLTHLEQREYTAPGLLEHLQQVQRSAERAAGLTRQLLAFSRRQVIQPIVLDLNATLRDLEKMLRRLIAENIDLRLILAPAPAIVEVDPGQLEQVVVNLVVNARDAMADGGRLTLQTGHVVLDELHAATHADARTGPHILLEIADTGCGMSPDTLEHIFEPFFTTKPVGRGTGLGLSTVYGIVRQAGGHIDVQSAPGCGTHLRIYWPAARQPLPTTARSPASQAPPTGTETILICEDDDTVRGLTTQILTDAGYQVLIAPTPHIALQTVQNHAGPLQLLITDVIMPDMNGRLLSEALVKLRPSLRTLFISGYTSDIIAHHGVPAESIEFLEKPFSPRALLLRVRQVLDKPAPPAGFTASPPDVQDRASG